MCDSFLEDERKAKATARKAEIEQAELDNLLGPRHIETQIIKRKLKDRSLMLHDVRKTHSSLSNSPLVVEKWGKWLN